jgi:limonene-1,2-epoxide hydrolase
VSDAIQTVRDFVDTINEGPDGFGRAVARWFTPQTVWENVGMAKTTGPEQALGFMQSMSTAGIATFRVENLAIAAQGNKVLTERIDYLMNAAGEVTLELRVMGIFEVDGDGKIERWADYFDASPFKTPPAS